MTTTRGSNTDAKRMRLPSDGRKRELVDGEIRVTPAGMRHGHIASLLKCIARELSSQEPAIDPRAS